MDLVSRCRGMPGKGRGDRLLFRSNVRYARGSGGDAVTTRRSGHAGQGRAFGVCEYVLTMLRGPGGCKDGEGAQKQMAESATLSRHTPDIKQKFALGDEPRSAHANEKMRR